MALSAHVASGPEEAVDVARLVWLADGVSDPWARHEPLHLTASALVVHPPSGRVLLRWHAKQERWLQVGGHADAGELDPWAIALREAREETAAPDLRPWPGPEPALAQVAIVEVTAVGDDPAHRHGDLRYLLATDRPDEVPPVVEGVPLRWCTLTQAREVADEGLARLLDAAERSMESTA